MERYLFIKLRLANKDDFSDQWGQKRTGTIYFQQNSTGAIEKKACYFTELTDLKIFRELYTHNQIYVPVNTFDDLIIVEENKLEAKSRCCGRCNGVNDICQADRI